MNHTKQLRTVIVGVGAGILNGHRPGLQLETANLVAASDINVPLGQERAVELGCVFYSDHRSMLAEIEPDVAVILTPHPFHAPIAIDCLRAGCHVLVEKPMAVHAGEADAMIEAATQAGRLLAVNYQQRNRPEVRKARDLIRQGYLGAIQHVDMVAAWTRTGVYYESSPWRGTWGGEGGGVLLNQAPHDLDMLCYLLGMPSRVVAWTPTLLHSIETEDTVQAMLEWADGTLGSMHISTAETGRSARFEILGTGGHLQIGRGVLTLQQFEVDLREHIVQSSEPYRGLQAHPVAVELGPGAGDHLSIHRNLHEAILRGAPLVADGVAGRMSLELANAMIASSYAGETVELPLDRDKYTTLLDDLKAGRIGHNQ